VTAEPLFSQVFFEIPAHGIPLAGTQGMNAKLNSTLIDESGVTLAELLVAGVRSGLERFLLLRVGMRGASTLLSTKGNQQGFTLPETLLAVGILAVGLVGVLAAMGHGVTSVDSARRATTALFLAEQRIEQVKAFALNKTPGQGQGWGVLTTASFPAEAYKTMAGNDDYRRTVTVTDVPTANGTTAKRVDVQVFYRPVNGSGAETFATVSTQLITR
jgi:prepilin-type N-terminal cleavage/methylation domain-containing protein